MSRRHAKTATKTANMPALLLAWYDRHRRSLPWRAPPGRRTEPYRVWLSEIMLQQTTVVTVGPYFRDFLGRWPTVHDLARAELDAVLHAWQGLGYYARARNLHKCAKVVSRELGGRFPDREDELLKLPGIGPYTAAAIAAIAFDRQATVMDGNVERVMARLHAVETPLPAAKPELRRLAAALTPAERPGDYAQAVMDLGATVCTPRKPRCMRLSLAGALPRAASGALPRPCRANRRSRSGRRSMRWSSGCTGPMAPSYCSGGRRKDCSAASWRCRRRPGARTGGPWRKRWDRHRQRRAGDPWTAWCAMASHTSISR